MEARQPTFMLLPSFNYLPDRDLHLGSVLTSAKGSKLPDAKRPLNSAARVSVDAREIQTQHHSPWRWEGSRAIGNKAGLNAGISFFTGVGANSAVNLYDDKGLSLVCDDLEITTFRPSQAYLAQTLQDDLVKTVGWKLNRPALYMITGLMIATAAEFTVSRDHGQTVSGAAQADMTSLSVPINVGPELEHKRSQKDRFSGSHSQSFILAYELIRIRRKRDGSVEERDENKWALFGDDDASVDSFGEQGLCRDWDVAWADPEHLYVL